ncbi:MAG: SDR family NAD(P)-dependent oxidoreductase [Acidimicrobiales bacterium]
MAGGALEGRVTVVTGADSPVGPQLVAALAGAGATVAAVGAVDPAALPRGSSGLDLAVAADLRQRHEVAEAFGSVAAVLGPIDAAVHAHIDPEALERRDLAAVDDVMWGAAWEGSLQPTIWCLQGAFAQMRGRGGRIVVVTPTIGLFGAAGYVPWACAAEGQRLLAKSAARQWGSDGVTVNCLAAAPDAFVGDLHAEEVSLASAALGRGSDPGGELASLLVFLVGEGSHSLTGATLCADGGVWMAP